MSKKNLKPVEESESEVKAESKIFDSKSLIVIFTLALSAIFYLWKIIFATGMLPGHSSDLIELPVIAQLESILVYHQFPLWNHLWFGGFPEYASPISALYDPLITLPYLLFGLLDGVKVIVVLHVFLAGVCFWLFSTTITSNKMLQLYGALLFMLSGSLAGRIDAGHTELLTTQMFIPLSMFFIVKATENKDIFYIILSAISLSMFVFGGAIYYLAFFMMMFFIYSLLNCVTLRNGKYGLKFDNFKVLSLVFILFLMFSSIKLIPVLLIGDNITRIDPIQPFKGSGIFKETFTLFFTGNSLDEYPYYESYAYLGFIPFIFAMLSVFNRSEKKLFLYPSFIAFLLWAGGGNTLFGILRYLPLFENFRVPGRSMLFASFVVIALSLYGLQWFIESYEKDKKALVYLLSLIGVILFFELQEFIIDSGKVLFSDLGIGFVGLVSIVAVSFLLLIKNKNILTTSNKIIFMILFTSIVLIAATNITIFKPYENNIENATSNELMLKIKEYDSGNNQQIWLTTDGWPYYHMDYAYEAMNAGLHMQRAYYAYFLNTVPSTVQIGDISYYPANYLIDTQYLETGEAIDAPALFDVNGVSVIELPNSLPNVFAIRNGILVPLEAKYLSPNKVTVDSSLVNEGDIVVYKSSFYKGWKVNGDAAENVGSMVGSQINDASKDVEFVFDPTDFKIGLAISFVTLLGSIGLIIKRKKVNSYLFQL